MKVPPQSMAKVEIMATIVAERSGLVVVPDNEQDQTGNQPRQDTCGG